MSITSSGLCVIHIYRYFRVLIDVYIHREFLQHHICAQYVTSTFSLPQAIPGQWWQHLVASIGLFIYLIIVAFYVSEMELPAMLEERRGTISRFVGKPSETRMNGFLKEPLWLCELLATFLCCHLQEAN